MYEFRNWLLKTLLCRLLSVHAKEPGANVCSRCGYILNPNMYKHYKVTLMDGTEVDVTAVNKAQAVKAVTLGYQDAMLMTKDANAGTRDETIKIHPENIKNVRPVLREL